MFGNKKKAKALNLMETGSLAVGTIANVRDTGVTINELAAQKQKILAEM